MSMNLRSTMRVAALAALMTSATIQATSAQPISASVSSQVHAQAPHTPIPPTASPDQCSYNSGMENESIGALYYVREVMDDAIIKYERYQSARKSDPTAKLEAIETHNDYLCDVRASLQGTLEFMTVNLLIWAIDYLNSDNS